MSLIKKKLDELDVTWKIAFRKTILVFGCYFGGIFAFIIILFGLSIILIPLSPLIPHAYSTFFNETTIRFFLTITGFIGFLIGLFKALIDIKILTKADLSTS